MTLNKTALILVTFVLSFTLQARDHTPPDEIQFVRQGVRRLIFDEEQAIPLASLIPSEVIGLDTMHPVHVYTTVRPNVSIDQDLLSIRSETHTEASLWFGGFNPFATYTLDLNLFKGTGAIGFEFSDRDKRERFVVTVSLKDNALAEAQLKIIKEGQAVTSKSILTGSLKGRFVPGKIILQMLGSGFSLFSLDKGLPVCIGQSDFSRVLDLREQRYIALMMDRYNYPGLKGPHWSYGALYLYYGYDSNLQSQAPRRH